MRRGPILSFQLDFNLKKKMKLLQEVVVPLTDDLAAGLEEICGKYQGFLPETFLEEQRTLLLRFRAKMDSLCSDHLSLLPRDILMSIFSYLPVNDRISVGRVCHLFGKLLEPSWKEVCLDTWRYNRSDCELCFENYRKVEPKSWQYLLSFLIRARMRKNRFGGIMMGTFQEKTDHHGEAEHEVVSLRLDGWGIYVEESQMTIGYFDEDSLNGIGSRVTSSGSWSLFEFGEFSWGSLESGNFGKVEDGSTYDGELLGRPDFGRIVWDDGFEYYGELEGLLPKGLWLMC